jgi:hypothetical protein
VPGESSLVDLLQDAGCFQAITDQHLAEHCSGRFALLNCTLGSTAQTAKAVFSRAGGALARTCQGRKASVSQETLLVPLQTVQHEREGHVVRPKALTTVCKAVREQDVLQPVQ